MISSASVLASTAWRASRAAFAALPARIADTPAAINPATLARLPQLRATKFSTLEMSVGSLRI
jgi:hypothetical protein